MVIETAAAAAAALGATAIGGAIPGAEEAVAAAVESTTIIGVAPIVTVIADATTTGVMIEIGMIVAGNPFPPLYNQP